MTTFESFAQEKKNKKKRNTRAIRLFPPDCRHRAEGRRAYYSDEKGKRRVAAQKSCRPKNLLPAPEEGGGAKKKKKEVLLLSFDSEKERGLTSSTLNHCSSRLPGNRKRKEGVGPVLNRHSNKRNVGITNFVTLANC